MNINHKQKSFEKPLRKSAKYALTAFSAVMAVVMGIQFGNLLYKLDVHTIGTIDPNNFKNIISLSIPIIESVYNSGKYSVSFSGEVKELFTKVFGFDLDSPASIFNAQSPIFKSYYRIRTMNELSMNDNAQSGIGTGNGNADNVGSTDDGAVVGDNGEGTGSGSVDAGKDGTNGNGNAAGAGSGDNAGSGSNSGSGDGTDSPGTNKAPDGSDLNTGNSDGTSESSMSFGTEYVIAPDPGITNQTNNGAVTGGNNQFAPGVQPISSVSYETEDEKEGDEKETVELDKIQIKNYTKHTIDIAKLLKEPLDIDMSKKGPKVLIYHTHTTESYVLKESDLGKKDVSSFNSSPKYNVVRVGEELARNLEKYGIETLHNGTVHDKVHDAAYGASINTVQSYKKSYPSIQVYIDIHRDAVDSDKPKLRMTKEINGKNCAQIMFVVGADGVLPHPQWQENLKFVLKLQQKLNEKYPGLAKPIRIVGKRYNQHISNNAILIEVGGDGNLLSESIESTKYLAEVLNDVMKGD
jgi:stage II sporulation protein P